MISLPLSSVRQSIWEVFFRSYARLVCHVGRLWRRSYLERFLLLSQIKDRIHSFLLKRHIIHPQFQWVESRGCLLSLPIHLVEEYEGDQYEIGTTRQFLRFLKPGAVVVDVGSHVGYYSVLAGKAVGPGGRVFAFEASPETFKVLQRNMAVNGLRNIVPVPKAVTNKRECRSFHFMDFSDRSSLFTQTHASVMTTFPVECISLDEFLLGCSLDVAKIDVEGAEPLVLEGMSQTIRRSQPLTLIIEFNPACLRQGGFSPYAFPGYVRTLGFKIWVIEETTGDLKNLTTEFIQTLEQQPSGYHVNLLCIK